MLFIFLFIKFNNIYDKFLRGDISSYFPSFFSLLDFSHLIPQSHSTHIPQNYSFLEEFPDCISTIYNQYQEPTCFAYASITVFSQRFCRETGMKFNFNPYDLIHCDKLSSNSIGSHEQISWRYLQLHGVANQSCSPYIQEPEPTPNPMYPFNPQQNFIRSSSSFCQHNYTCKHYYAKLHSEKTLIGEDEIRREIKNHGPVTAVLEMTEDFYNYDSNFSIFRSKGEIEESHTIVLFGWGEENGIPYWIGQNSYGSKWGRNGYFRILRGENLCGIEQYASSISPNLKSL